MWRWLFSPNPPPCCCCWLKHTTKAQATQQPMNPTFSSAWVGVACRFHSMLVVSRDACTLLLIVCCCSLTNTHKYNHQPDWRCVCVCVWLAACCLCPPWVSESVSQSKHGSLRALFPSFSVPVFFFCSLLLLLVSSRVVLSFRSFLSLLLWLFFFLSLFSFLFWSCGHCHSKASAWKAGTRTLHFLRLPFCWSMLDFFLLLFFFFFFVWKAAFSCVLSTFITANNPEGVVQVRFAAANKQQV